MTHRFVAALLALVLLAAPAWAKDARDDTDFVTRASLGNLFAIAESQLAVDRATDPNIKAFAKELVDAQGKAQAALLLAADGSGATVPINLDPDHQTRLTALKGQTGAAFDAAYAADQAEDHSNLLTLYADYMLLGADPMLKALAIKMIPIAGAQFKEAQVLLGR